MSGKELAGGFACTGSFCTFGQMFPAMEETAKRFGTVIPILSEYSAATDTRFGKAEEFAAEMERICGRPPLNSITAVEPIGPEKLLDVLVIAPCTGNTLAKMAAGVTDSSVTMAAKAHLRNGRRCCWGFHQRWIGCLSAQSGGAERRKNIYLIPFRQDNPLQKPNSLVADMSQIPAAIEAAMEHRQLQPVLLGAKMPF